MRATAPAARRTSGATPRGRRTGPPGHVGAPGRGPTTTSPLAATQPKLRGRGRGSRALQQTRQCKSGRDASNNSQSGASLVAINTDGGALSGQRLLRSASGKGVNEASVLSGAGTASPRAGPPLLRAPTHRGLPTTTPPGSRRASKAPLGSTTARRRRRRRAGALPAARAAPPLGSTAAWHPPGARPG